MLQEQPDALATLVELLQGYRDKQYHTTLTLDILCVLRRILPDQRDEFTAQVCRCSC